MGSVRLASTASSHSITFDHAFAPFGEMYNKVIGGISNPAFATLTRNTISDEYDTQNRELHPNQGRWISPDPLRLDAADPTNPQSWNLYAYTLNNPLSYVDPTGLFCVWDNGSYDSADDPFTGSEKKCKAKGGTWLAGTPDMWVPNAADWSGQQTAEFAAYAQAINPSVADFGTPTGKPDVSALDLGSVIPDFVSTLNFNSKAPVDWVEVDRRSWWTRMGDEITNWVLYSRSSDAVACATASDATNDIREAKNILEGTKPVPSDEGHPEGGGAIWITNVNSQRHGGYSTVGSASGASQASGAALAADYARSSGTCLTRK
jgi:RHS repeat-associated protein